MRDWLIAFNKKNGLIQVLNYDNYAAGSPKDYFVIDDSDSEYKAQIKAKEIKFMGISKYIDNVVRNNSCEQLS